MEQNMVVVGLTGQSGAGKSTVSQMFSDHGAEILDADKIARVTIENSRGCLMDLVLEFSTDVIRADASLNREKLAELCFSDKKKLKRLDEITYPYIIAAIEDKIKRHEKEGTQLLVLDAPTLYEAGLDYRCDKVVAVLADEEKRVQRIIARDSLTEDAARLRINAQNKDAFYTERADYILRNDDDLDVLRFAFMEIFAKIERLIWGDDAVLLEPEPDDTEDAAEDDGEHAAAEQFEAFGEPEPPAEET